MYSCKLTIVSNDASTGEAATKDFNGVNQNLIKQVGVGADDPGASIPTTILPRNYDTFWDWVDAVARGINSLTTNTYRDGRIQAVFSANEELA